MKKVSLSYHLTEKIFFDIVLDLCQFDFNFPFANKKKNVKIKKFSMGEIIERLVIEEETNHSSIAISDYGISFLPVTQFGECEKVLLCENALNIVVESVHQIAENDSVSLVVRRAIQRGMALKKIKMQSGCTGSEQIIDETIQLGTVAIGEDEMKKKETEIFTEYVKIFYFVLSNEESFQKVKDFCNKTEEYIRSPLHIEAEWATIQMIVVDSNNCGWIFSSSRCHIHRLHCWSWSCVNWSSRSNFCRTSLCWRSCWCPCSRCYSYFFDE